MLMSFRSLRLLFFCCLVFFFSGCAGLNEMSAQESFEGAQRDFLQRLRWQDYSGAANYFSAEQRPSFLTEFLDQKDLHITDVRSVGLDSSDEGLAAKQTVDLEYYALPSLRVRDFRFTLDWSYICEKNNQTGDWKIVNPFPAFPPQ